MKNTMKRVGTLFVTLLIGLIFAMSANALWFGDYIYEDFICHDYNGDVCIRFIDNTTSSEVIIPDKINGKSVTEISIYSDYDDHRIYNDSVVSLSLPDTVKKVSISGLINLEKVYLRGNFSISLDLFNINSEKLNFISVETDNINLFSMDGVLFSKDMKYLYKYPNGKTDKHYNLPVGVETICEFKNNHIESLYLPETITSVPWSLMFDCPNINKISVDNIESWFTISACYFFDSPWQPYDLYIGDNILKELVIPNGITAINDYTFYNCRSIERIVVPESLKRVGRNTFVGTTWMKNQIGDIIYLDNIALSNNSTSSIISIREGTKYIADSAFAGYENNIEKVILPNSLLEIGEDAFLYCEKLKEIFIPKSVEHIGAHAIGYYAYGYAGADTIYAKYDNSLVIKGTKDSAAETYAKENGITFIAIDDLPQPPTPPTIIKASTQTTKTITLTWDKCEGATGYRVYKYNSSSKKYTLEKSIKTNKHKVTNLKSGTSYKFKIRPYTKLDDGTVLWGEYSEVFTTATKPATPTIKTISTTKGKAVVSWSNISGETGYQLYYSTKKDSGYKKVKNYSANTLKGSKSKLTSGKKYYFKVRAYKKVDGKVIYGSFSSVKSIKIK